MTQWSQSLSLESRKIRASEGVTTVGEHTYHSGTRERVTRLEARVEGPKERSVMTWKQEWMPLIRLSKTFRTNVVGWAATRRAPVEVLKAQIQNLVAEFTVLKRAGRLSVSKPRSLGLGSEINTTSLSFRESREGRAKLAF